MTRVLSFDPGGTTGWCYQNEDEILAFGQAKDLVELMQVCEKYKDITDELVIEDYIILGKKAMSHSGSRVPAIQIIGYLKAWGLMNKIPCTLYPARLKPLQQKKTQMFPVGKHSDNHWVDAFNHGRYHLIDKFGAPSALEIKRAKENGN